MRSKSRQLLWIAAVVAGTGFQLLGGEFAAPAEGPVAFRRDKIPLDVEAMAGLSRQLEIMARGLNAETPVDHRGAAQMLALAVALDPANGKARDLIAEYQEDRHKPDTDADRLEKSRARIWQTIAWLETPEAGSHGQALAACLKDVIIISDPKHPRAGILREAGEKGAWAGWVPAISAYEPKALAAKVEPVIPEPVVPEATQSGIRLDRASVRTVLWQKEGTDDSAKWVLAAVPLEMSARKVEAGEEGEHAFSISIGANHGLGLFGGVTGPIRNLLNQSHGKLPQGVRIEITSKELERSLESRKLQSISAAAAVLASSAITGREPDAIIIGQIDGTGAFKLSSGFWDQLQALGKGNGQRLVLPAEAAAYLPSVLAFEKPGFFLEYEVLLAGDFKQLLDCSAKTLEGSLAASSAKFREIRERAGTQDVRQYIANSFVKQRLTGVLQDTPTHISARMLLIQAAGNRPTLVGRSVLAAEIRRALEPMVWIVKTPDFGNPGGLEIPKTGQMGQTYELCRSRVEALERYAEKNDRELIERAREVVVAIRTLDKAARSRGEDFMVTSSVQSAKVDVSRLYRALMLDLARATGETPGQTGAR